MPVVGNGSATFMHGKNSCMFIDDYDLSAYFKKASKNAQWDQADSTGFGSNMKHYEVGIGDASVQADGMYSGDANGIGDVFNVRLGSRTRCINTIGHQAAKAGNVCSTGKTLPSRFDVTSDASNVVSVNYEAKGDNGVWSGRFLNDYATSITATGATNSTGADFGANQSSTPGGLVVSLHVITNTLTTTFDCKIQDSADNTAFSDIAGFTFAQTATLITGAQHIHIDRVTTRRYLRAVFTVGATPTGAVTCVVAAAKLPDIQ